MTKLEILVSTYLPIVIQFCGLNSARFSDNKKRSKKSTNGRRYLFQCAPAAAWKKDTPNSVFENKLNISLTYFSPFYLSNCNVTNIKFDNFKTDM